LARALAHNRLFREILRDKLRRKPFKRLMKKTAENPRNPRFFRDYRRWDLNPHPLAGTGF
jgi:hypothetical protein